MIRNRRIMDNMRLPQNYCKRSHNIEDREDMGQKEKEVEGREYRRQRPEKPEQRKDKTTKKLGHRRLKTQEVEDREKWRENQRREKIIRIRYSIDGKPQMEGRELKIEDNGEWMQKK